MKTNLKGKEVTVVIEGPNTVYGRSYNCQIGKGQTITAKGIVVGEIDNNWIVRLNGELCGIREMAISKDKVK